MADPLIVLDKYEVLRHLASGGMGDIYLARQRGRAGFERLAVLKSLRPDFSAHRDSVALFLNEARAAAKLNHPNVVAVYEVDEDRGVFFIAMELIEGTDARRLISRMASAGQRVPFRIAAHVVAGAALGLAHAHAAAPQVIHRDVSPSNVMIRLDGAAKIVDFGVAAVRDRSDPLGTSARLGKARYVAPEQLLGDGVDPRTDQYALGLVLWELLTSQRVFEGLSHEQIRERVVRGHIEAPSAVSPKVPAALESICQRMLHVDPEQRFETCEVAARALTRYLDDSGGSAAEAAGKFMRMVGAKDAAIDTAAPSEPVHIAGLLQHARGPCPACGYENPLRNLYCGSCGAPLAREPKATPSLRPRARQTASVDLLASAADLSRGLAGVRREVTAIAGRIHSTPAGNASVLGILETLSSQSDLHVILQREDEFLWVVEGAPGPRTLELILRLEAALGSCTRTCFVVLFGPCELRRAAGRIDVRGETIDRARTLVALADDVGERGILTDASLQARVPSARFAPIVLHRPGPLPVVQPILTFEGLDEVAESPLLGRAEPLLAARALLTRALERRGGAQLFTGSPGCGKTAFLDAIGAEAEALTITPCRVTGEAIASSVLGALDLPGASLGRQAHLEALGLAPTLLDARPDHEGTTPVGAAVAVVRAASRHTPLALLVDDLHRASGETQATLRGLATLAATTRLAIFATAEAFDAPALDPAPPPIPLAPLSDEHILQLVGAHLGGPRHLDTAAARLVLSRSEGNPGVARLVADVLRVRGHLAERGTAWALTSDPSLAALPSAPRALLEARASQLSKPTHVFLQVGAVLGDHFSPRLAKDALGPKGQDHDVVAEAVGAGILRPLGPTDVAEFSRTSIADAIRDGLLPEDRARIHARLAQVLARDPKASPLALAHHRWHAGDRGAEFLQSLLRGVDHLGPDATSRALVRAGIEGLGAWLDAGQLVDPHTAADVHRFGRTAVALLAPHDLRAAAAALDPVMAHVPADLDPTGRIGALVERARVRLKLGALDGARADLDDADALAESHQTHAAQWDRALLRAEQLERAGHTADAVAQLAATMAAEDVRPAWAECTLANALGRIAFRDGDIDRARDLFGHALQSARDAGLKGLTARAGLNLGAALARAGDPAATATLTQARADAEAAGDLVEQARASHNLGMTLRASGDAAEARAAFEEASRCARAVGWAEGVALSAAALDQMGAATGPQANR